MSVLLLPGRINNFIFCVLYAQSIVISVIFAYDSFGLLWEKNENKGVRILIWSIIWTCFTSCLQPSYLSIASLHFRFGNSNHLYERKISKFVDFFYCHIVNLKSLLERTGMVHSTGLCFCDLYRFLVKFLTLKVSTTRFVH